MTEITLLNRYVGAMVGVHVGDSIGAPYETWGPKKIAADIAARGGLKFFEYPNPWVKDRGETMMPPGRPTDDSDQTADLAYSLIACNGLDTEHLREALRDSVVRNKSRLWDGVSDGAGGTTRKALSDDPEKIAAAMQNNIGTNGSLMRSVPMALWMHGHLESAEFYNAPNDGTSRPNIVIEDMSRVTHAHWHSQMTCVIYSHALSYVLEYADDKYFNQAVMLEQLSYRFKPLPLFMRIDNSLNDKYMFPIDPGAWPARGTAEFSLYAALWCFKHATSFEDGIERAVRIGGDTDTYAAIAGGLLGAYYGYDTIPEKWRNTILGHDTMVEYAHKLYELNQQK